MGLIEVSRYKAQGKLEKFNLVPFALCHLKMVWANDIKEMDE